MLATQGFKFATDDTWQFEGASGWLAKAAGCGCDDTSGDGHGRCACARSASDHAPSRSLVLSDYDRPWIVSKSLRPMSVPAARPRLSTRPWSLKETGLRGFAVSRGTPVAQSHSEDYYRASPRRGIQGFIFATDDAWHFESAASAGSCGGSCDGDSVQSEVKVEGAGPCNPACVALENAGALDPLWQTQMSLGGQTDGDDGDDGNDDEEEEEEEECSDGYGVCCIDIWCRPVKKPGLRRFVHCAVIIETCDGEYVTYELEDGKAGGEVIGVQQTEREVVPAYIRRNSVPVSASGKPTVAADNWQYFSSVCLDCDGCIDPCDTAISGKLPEEYPHINTQYGGKFGTYPNSNTFAHWYVDQAGYDGPAPDGAIGWDPP